MSPIKQPGKAGMNHPMQQAGAYNYMAAYGHQGYYPYGNATNQGSYPGYGHQYGASQYGGGIDMHGQPKAGQQGLEIGGINLQDPYQQYYQYYQNYQNQQHQQQQQQQLKQQKEDEQQKQRKSYEENLLGNTVGQKQQSQQKMDTECTPDGDTEQNQTNQKSSENQTEQEKLIFDNLSKKTQSNHQPDGMSIEKIPAARSLLQQQCEDEFLNQEFLNKNDNELDTSNKEPMINIAQPQQSQAQHQLTATNIFNIKANIKNNQEEDALKNLIINNENKKILNTNNDPDKQEIFFSFDQTNLEENNDNSPQAVSCKKTDVSEIRIFGGDGDESITENIEIPKFKKNSLEEKDSAFLMINPELIDKSHSEIFDKSPTLPNLNRKSSLAKSPSKLNINFNDSKSANTSPKNKGFGFSFNFGTNNESTHKDSSDSNRLIDGLSAKSKQKSERVMCVLCRLKFIGEDALKLHKKLSNLHKVLCCLLKFIIGEPSEQ